MDVSCTLGFCNQQAQGRRIRGVAGKSEQNETLRPAGAQKNTATTTKAGLLKELGALVSQGLLWPHLELATSQNRILLPRSSA